MDSDQYPTQFRHSSKDVKLFQSRVSWKLFVKSWVGLRFAGLAGKSTPEGVHERAAVAGADTNERDVCKRRF